ncbi:serine hydrolase domain-containing protein [Sphingobacterium bovisgrunnientis]|uniref:serine hydrolase domain-containing protein n=1 Tax=Sphingobacterium bovisgrunnientis TaxID=1874697 RepID=UPI00135A541E|nr:serine hydrolase domain-containing protein [Sphingobacterium bovisgrunnientis]
MKRILPLITTIIFYFNFSHSSLAQEEKKERLTNYLNTLFTNKKVMGSVAISRNDSIIYSKAIGYANVEKNKLNDNNTAFRIGSLTKTYTAVLVMKAIEEKKIKLDDKLNLYYPQIKKSDNITIEMLLNHRSGLYNFTEKEEENTWSQTFHTEEEIINFFKNENNYFEPGTDYAYSNTNYVLLGFILQRLYNKSYNEILQQKICQPLNLQHTYFKNEIDETLNEAVSYNIQDEFIQNSSCNYAAHFASGGIFSSAIEVNQFIAALFNNKIISSESLSLMLPKEKGSYGFGIERTAFNSPEEGYKHGGRVENYFAEYWYFPKEKIGVVSLANATNISPFYMNNFFIQTEYGMNPNIPNFKKTNELTEEEFQQLSGTYSNEDKTYSFTISSNGNYLIFQNSAIGQMFISFEYTNENEFLYEDIKLTFYPNEAKAIVIQGNSQEVFLKKQSLPSDKS